MRHAFILGGTGQIGLATAGRLAREGWRVTLASRAPPPVRGPFEHVALDRADERALAEATREGADLLLDCVAFDARDAEGVLRLQARFGHVCAVSSASVYADREGRTLDEARERGFPEFPVPIREDHPTVAPGPETYSTRKVAMERRLLDGATTPVTILRPCAIHGPHSRHAREWWLVGRLLDGRRRIPLAYRGRSRFHTTATEAIAAAALHAAGGGGPSVVNVADPDAPSVAEIAWAVMDALGAEADLVGLPDEPFPPTAGVTPWSVPRPMVLASASGHAPVGLYRDLVPAAVRWLVEATRGRDWRAVLPQLAAYPRDLFDDDAEDRALARPGAAPPGLSAPGPSPPRREPPLIEKRPAGAGRSVGTRDLHQAAPGSGSAPPKDEARGPAGTASMRRR